MQVETSGHEWTKVDFSGSMWTCSVTSDLVKSQEIKSYVSEGESEKPNKTKIDIIIPSVPIQATGVKGKE